MKLYRKTAAALLAALMIVQSPPVAARVPAATAPVSAPAPKAEVARPALWRIADKDTTIYLFGTVHALPAGIDWYRGAVAAAFRQSAELVSEIGEIDPAAMQRGVLRYALLPKGEKLSDKFTSEENARIDAALAKVGMKREMVEPLKPWFVAMTISVLALKNTGMTGGEGVESALTKLARQQNIPQSGLETAEFQLGQFDNLSPDVQKRYLLEVADKFDEGPALLAAMVTQWKRGRADELARLMNQDQSLPELAEPLLYQRNRNWAEWIKARMAKPGRVFIAVGAGHLAGEGSVQRELAARGIRVTRVQ